MHVFLGGEHACVEGLQGETLKLISANLASYHWLGRMPTRMLWHSCSRHGHLGHMIPMSESKGPAQTAKAAVIKQLRLGSSCVKCKR